jgi:hypothetical protein
MVKHDTLIEKMFSRGNDQAGSYCIVAQTTPWLPSVYRGRKRMVKLLCEGNFSVLSQKIFWPHSVVVVTTSCIASKFLQQNPFYCSAHSGRRRLRLKTAIARKLFVEFPLQAFDVDTFIRCGAQFGFARIRSWHLLLLIRIVLIVSGAQ